MSDLTPWLVAAILMLPAWLVPLWVAATGRLANRLVAVQLASQFAVVTMILLSFAFDQPSALDLPLTLVFLSLPGTLLLAVFLERWM